MRKSVVVFVAVTVFGFAFVHSANAIAVPVDTPTAAASPNVFQAFVTELVDGAAAIIASIETTVGNFADSIGSASQSTNYTYTAAVGTVTPPPRLVVSGEGANASNALAPASAATPPAPPSIPTVTPASPTVPTTPGAASDNIFELESAVAQLTEGVQGLTALFEAQTPSSKIENQIASLQSALASQSSQNNAAAVYPLGDGTGLAAASNIGNLSGVTITNASINAASIPDLSGSYLSVSGGTLTGAFIDSGSASSSFAGAVGIGTTTPGSLLSLGGVGNFTTATSTFYSSGGFNLTGGGCFAVNGTCITAGGVSSQWTTAGSNIYFSTGSIGVGTTSPSALLTIDSSSATGTVLRISNDSAGGHIFDLLSTGSSNTGGAGRLDFFDNTAGVARLSIASNGNVGIGSTTPGTTFSVSGSGYFSGGLGIGALNTSAGTIMASTSYGIGGDVILVHPITSSPQEGGVTDSNVGLGSRALQAMAAFGATGNAEYNTAVGAGALLNATSTDHETAVGYMACAGLTSSTLGGASSDNTCIGVDSFRGITSGTENIMVGEHSGTYGSLASGGTINGGTYVGFDAGEYAGGSGNVALGEYTLGGSAAAASPITGNLNTTIGGSSGGSLTGIAKWNTFLGGFAGYHVTTGNSNLILGFEVGYSMLKTGSNNILIGAGGNNVDTPTSATSNFLNIGDLIYGTGLEASTGAASTTPAGNLGIGTTTPYSRLEVWGPDAASSTSAFAVVNTSSSTVFAVFDGGNAQLSGTLTQSSDQRLKTNIQSLDGSSSLAEINALNPVTFNWIDPNQDARPQFGFLAQQVQGVFPSLVSTTSPTALTPGGTLGLNYIDLISPIVAAIQELDKEITSLASTVAGFAQSITSAVGNFGQVNAHNVTADELCAGAVCVDQAQLAALVASANQSSSAPASPSPSMQTASDTPPVIQTNGDNPATIQVGASYTDLGAVITGPQADLNLGIQTYLNSTLESPITLDTSVAATDTIAYVVTDSQGLTSTSTRTIIIEPAAVPPPPASVDASSSATTTVQ